MTKNSVTRRRPTDNERRKTPVFSYRSNRSNNGATVGRGQEQTNQKRPFVKSRLRPISVWLVTALVVVSLLFVTRLSPPINLTILDKNKSQDQLQPPDTYLAAIRRQLSPLSAKNKLTVDTAKMAADLENQFPELNRVTLSVPVIGSRAVATLYPVTPAFVISGNGGSYVVAFNGKAIAKTTQLSKSAQSLPQVTDQTSFQIKIGQRILPEEHVAFITTFVNQLKAKKIKTTALLLPPAANEFDIRVEGQPYVIKTDLTGNARLQAGTYLAAKAKFETDKTIPAELVDTRIEERLYYK